jgi:hypothetical protein
MWKHTVPLKAPLANPLTVVPLSDELWTMRYAICAPLSEKIPLVFPYECASVHPLGTAVGLALLHDLVVTKMSPSLRPAGSVREVLSLAMVWPTIDAEVRALSEIAAGNGNVITEAPAR